MPPARRDVMIAVLLSGAAAAVADLRPPTLDDTAGYIATAVRRHHAPLRASDEDERQWNVAAEFSGCVVTKQTTHEERVLGTWQPKASAVRWRLNDIDPASIGVASEARHGKNTFVVTLPCVDGRACTDKGPLGRDRVASFEFTSLQIAQRVAAAFRHASTLCRDVEATPRP